MTAGNHEFCLCEGALNTNGFFMTLDSRRIKLAQRGVRLVLSGQQVAAISRAVGRGSDIMFETSLVRVALHNNELHDVSPLYSPI